MMPQYPRSRSGVLLWMAAAPIMLHFAPVRASSGDEALSEVIVTAQRRSEDLQQVPVAISVVDRDMLVATGADRLWDLGGLVPNLSLPGGFGRGPLAEIGIRGISTFVRNAGFESAVSVYMDDTYMGRSYGVNQPLPDVQSIEVLRGPQGTLFGRNSSAGAITITTVEPASVPKAELTAEGGNFDLWAVNGYVAGPVVGDSLLGKVSAFVREREGYMKNILGGPNVDSEDTAGTRGSLVWNVSSATSVRFSGDYVRYRPRAIYNDVIAGPAAAFAPRPLEVGINGGTQDDMDLYGGSISVKHNTHSGFTVTAISNVRHQRENVHYDDDNQPLDILESFITDKVNIFTQELRLASPTGGRIDYVSGLFFLDQRAERTTFERVKIFDPTDAFRVRGLVKTRSYAAYGQLNWHLTDAITLFGGLRYTREDKDLTFQQRGIANLGLPDFPLYTDSQTDDAWTPTLGVRYEFSRSLMGYISAARGFKAGGWNADLVSTLAIGFKPEYVTNYEGGFKSVLANGHVRVNAAVFHMDYDDLQVQQFRIASFETSNAGKARINGAELEGQALLGAGFAATTSVGYTDATYSRFDECAPGISCAGKLLRNAPKWTLAASIGYEHPLAVGGSFVARLEANYKGSVYFDAYNSPQGYVGSYTLLNTRFGWMGEHASVLLWGKNLADRLYLTNHQDFAIVGAELGSYGAPRTFGVTASWKL